MFPKIQKHILVLTQLVIFSTGVQMALAADVTVTPPIGGGFVVKDASNAQERFKVQESGVVTVPGLPSAAPGNTVLCFDNGTGRMGPCATGVAVGATGPAGAAGAIGATGPAGSAGAGLNTGSITGTIELCGQSVTRTLVYIPGRSSTTYTGSNGNFLFDNVPAGTYELVVEAPGISNSTIYGAISAVVVNNSQTTPTGTTNPIDFLGDANHCGNCATACSGLQTCSAGVCVVGACSTDADCGSGQSCSAGSCVVLGLAAGSACTASSSCASNNCSAGVCQ